MFAIKIIHHDATTDFVRSGDFDSLMDGDIGSVSLFPTIEAAQQLLNFMYVALEELGVDTSERPVYEIVIHGDTVIN